MSPRRMDISSLLCNDDDDDEVTNTPSTFTDRPRTIDALLHHPGPSTPNAPPSSSSLLSILNNTDPTVSPSNHTRRLSRPSPLTHSSPPSSPSTIHYLPTSYSPTEHRHAQNHPYVHHTSSPSAHTTQRSPFLGLDALLHVASEERRRISTASTTSPTAARSERDVESDHYRDRCFEQDIYPHARPHGGPVYDHHDEPHSRRYSHPLTLAPATHPHQRFLDHPPPLEDNARPHKRIRDVCPPSPLDPQLGSAITHLPSASTLNDYAMVRRQPGLHMDTTRSAPGLLVGLASDLRVLGPPQSSSSVPPSSPSVSSPLFQQHHPLHAPTHQSPRNHSPHRHSPQQLRSHYSPTQTSLAVSPSPAVDAMSPRFGQGPRMAGGISILTNDSTTERDLQRPGSSSFEGIRREAPRERFMYDIPCEHTQIPLQAPVPRLAIAVRHDKPHATEAQISPSKVEGMDGVLREQTQSRHPPPLPVGDSKQATNLVAHEAMAMRELAHLLPERHPIRVWEEQPERSWRISPPPVASVSHPVSDPGNHTAEEQLEISPINEGMRNDGSIVEDVVPMLREAVAEKLPTHPFRARREPSPLPPLLEASVTPKASASESQPPSRQSQVGPKSTPPTPTQSLLHGASEAQSQLSDASAPKVLSPRSPYMDASATSGIDLPVGPQCRSDSDPPDMRVMPDPQVSPPPSSPIKSEHLSNEVELISEPPAPDLSMTTVASNQQDISEHHQLAPVHNPDASKVPEPTPDSEATQSNNRSSSHPPHSVLVCMKEEQDILPEGISTLPNEPSPSPGQSPEPQPVSEHEPSVPESSMMDVDEELLRLVEDASVRAVPTVRKSQMKSNLASPMGPGADRGSSEAPGPSPIPSSHSITKAHLTIVDEDKDRASMPPPQPRTKKAEKDKGTTSTTTGNKKKKDTTSKAPAKPKQPPKPRAKPGPKTKAKSTVVDAPPKIAALKGGSTTNARSRSASVLPGAAEDPEPEPEAEAEESEKEDDKLYCVCKTLYDEDRMMIACDRCDEWFHTQCVKMPDLEIELVDQFICPPCIQKNPHLRTTWKRRCIFGLKHANPSSPDACHKPSRGAFSKYCSDECGIKSMQAHVARWENSGGTRDLLWQSVKSATKREGVVVPVETSSSSKMDVDNGNSQPKHEPLDAAAKRRAKREVARLNARLEDVVKEREFMKRELDMVLWREKVVDFASERAEDVDECGWDQRLCFGEEEWADFGAEVLESYEEERTKVDSGDDAMPLDDAPVSHGEWWCTGKKKCERHAGWQKLRIAEVSFDKETNEAILLKLTTQEREIRKRIEDILYPQSTNPSKSLHSEPQLNGSGKSRSLGNVSDRGKKKES